MNSNNKKRMLTAFMVLILLYMAAYIIGSMQNARVFAQDTSDNYEGVIRFHVKANSNTEEDQALKLKVRDGVLLEINDLLAEETVERYDAAASVYGNDKSAEADDAVSSVTEKEDRMPDAKLSLAETREILADNLDRIEAEADRIIKENGYEYEVKAKLGIAFIPEKTYGDVTFPAGSYEALTVEIGKARGDNWWCVLFPPLCIIDPSGSSLKEIETDTVKTGDHETNVIKLKFKTKEILDSMQAK